MDVSFSQFTLLDEQPHPDTEVVPVPGRSLAKVDLLATALARFGNWRPEVDALIQKYKDVVFDVASTRGMAEALAARLEVRKARFAAQNTSTASKSELAAVSKSVGAEEEAIKAALKPTEDAIDAQITAEVARKKRIEDERKAADDARRLVHTNNLAQLGSYVASAAGKNAGQLAGAIRFVEDVDTSAYEEFSGEAGAIKLRTLDALRRMHNLALDEDEAAAKREAARIEQERIATQQRETDARLAAERATFEAEKAAWLASQQPAAPVQQAAAEVNEQNPSPLLFVEPTPPTEPIEALPLTEVAMPKPMRKALNGTGARVMAELTSAELRTEFLLFLDAIERVVPAIAKHAAPIDSRRFMVALKRLNDVMA